MGEWTAEWGEDRVDPRYADKPMEGFEMNEPMSAGNKFTFIDLPMLVRNPDRRWWQFWKPQHIMVKQDTVFTVTATWTGSV